MRSISQSNGKWKIQVRVFGIRCWKRSLAGLLLFLLPVHAGLTPEHRSLLQWITNRPPIREIVLKLSANHRSLGQPKEAFFLVRGAIQPGRFLLHMERDPLTGMRRTVGESDRYYWKLTPRVVSIAPKTGPGASEKNLQRLNSLLDKSLLLSWSQPGLGYVAHCTQGKKIEWKSIRFLDSTNFAGYWSYGEIPIHGYLILNQAGIPVGSHYEGRRKGEFIIVDGVLEQWSRWGNGDWYLPKRWVEHVRKRTDLSGTTEKYLTNEIVSLKIGFSPNAEKIFRLSTYLTSNELPREVYMGSNGVMHELTQAGWRPLSNEGPPPSPFIKEYSWGKKTISTKVLFLGVVLMISIVFLVILMLTRGKHPSSVPSEKIESKDEV